MGWLYNQVDNLANYLDPSRARQGQGFFSYTRGSEGSRAGLTIDAQNVLKNSTVFSCVNLIADTIAQTDVAVVESGAKEFTPMDDHPITRLLKRPNELQTRYEFIHSILVDMLTYGNSYIQIVGSGDSTILIPLDPRGVTIARNAAGRLVYNVEYQTTALTQDEVIHFRDIATHNGVGLSRVLQCADLVALDNRLDYAIADILKNANRITGMVTTPQTLDETQAKSISDALAPFQGDGDAVGSLAVLGGGMTYEQIDFLTVADADAINLKKQLMARIAAIFRVPAQYIELADNNKYNNVSQKKTGFYSDTISPQITNLEQKLAMKLLPSTDLTISFDRDTLLKGDLNSQANIASNLVRSNVWTPNDARNFLGDEPLSIEEANRLMGQAEEPEVSPDASATE